MLLVDVVHSGAAMENSLDEGGVELTGWDALLFFAMLVKESFNSMILRFSSVISAS